MVGRKQVSFDNYSSDIEWTKEDCEFARNFVQGLFKNCVISEVTLESKLHDLSDTVQEIIKQCYEIRKQEILQAVLKEHLMKTGEPVVENVDWKLKWVLGSSKLVTLNEPLLQVDLHCLQNKDSVSRSTVNFEINLEQTDMLIAELERVKAELAGST